LRAISILASSMNPNLWSLRPTIQIDRFGTLNIASRFLPKLCVAIKVAVNVRLRPDTAATTHLLALVIRFPFFGFFPAIVTLAAMRATPLLSTIGISVAAL
jgi:hypothetical protein